MRNELQEKELELLKKLCASENVSLENEGMLVKRLYDYINYDVDTEDFLDTLENDIENDIIGYIEGRDGKYYFWYLDEMYNKAIDEDGVIIDDEKIDEILA